MSCICMTSMGGGGIGSFIDDSIAISSDGSALANDDATSNGNIGIGTEAGSYITTGSYNVGIGEDALKGDATAKLTGSNNVGLGYQAGYGLSTGKYNVLGGYQAGYGLTVGDDNVLIGKGAGKSMTDSDNSVCIGSGSGEFITSSANSGNVCVGYLAGRATQAGNLGSYDGEDGIAIGKLAYLSASKEMSLGNSTYITAAFTAQPFTTRSDERQKDFVPMDLGLDFINSLEPKKYTWNTGADKTTINYGFSAQQTRRCLDAAGVAENAKMHVIRGDNPDAEQNLTYTEFIAPAIQAIQDLSCLVDAIRTEINATKGAI